MTATSGTRLIAGFLVAVLEIAGLPQAKADPQSAESAALDEIVVTAQKRPEKLRDVPIAIIAVSGESMRDNDVHELSDLNSSVPDFHVNQAFAQGYLSIRGLSSGINPGFESTVGQVIDGYFYPRDRFAYLSFLDIDRVEILKGPQGALIGKNTTAGAINITTAQPTRTFQGYVQVDDEFQGDRGFTEQAALSGPLTDTLAGRIAIRADNHDGYLDRQFGGGLEPTRDNKYGRATLAWDPIDDLSITASAARAEEHEHGRNIALISCDQNFKNLLVAQNLAKYEDCARNFNTGENYARPAIGPGQFDVSDTTSDMYNFTVNYKTPIGTISALTGYASFDFLGQESGLRTAVNTRAVDLGEDWKQISEEVRLVSNPGGRFDYILGGYFLTSNQSTLDGISIFGPPPGFSAFIYAEVDSKTYAGFGNFVWHITNTLDATLEGRYTREDKDGHLFENTTALLNQTAVTKNNYDISLSRSENNFSPGVDLKWKPSQDLLLYAKWNQGFKGGGYNDFLNATSNAQARSLAEFGPEKVNAYELGSKWTFAGGTALWTAALFRSDTSNLQVTALIPGGQIAAFAVQNAASATSQGLESELSWRPIEPLVIGVRGAYLDAKYNSFPNSQCYTAQTVAAGCINHAQSLSGQILPFSPKLAASIDAEYTWHLSDAWKLAIFGQADYSDWYWTEFTSDPTSRLGSFTKYNARISVGTDRLQFALVGRNLSNVFTFAGASQINISSGGTSAAAIDPPRELSVQVRYRF